MCMCVYEPPMCRSPLGSEEASDPLDPELQIGAAVWVHGTKPGSSAGAVSTLTTEPSLHPQG